MFIHWKGSDFMKVKFLHNSLTKQCCHIHFSGPAGRESLVIRKNWITFRVYLLKSEADGFYSSIKDYNMFSATFQSKLNIVFCPQSHQSIRGYTFGSWPSSLAARGCEQGCDQGQQSHKGRKQDGEKGRKTEICRRYDRAALTPKPKGKKQIASSGLLGTRLSSVNFSIKPKILV